MKTAAILILGIGIFISCVREAPAHDWYPHECCNDKDCAPARFTYHDDGSITAKTKFGTVKFPKDFSRTYMSKDGGNHACMRSMPYSEFGAGGTYMQPICLFKGGVS